MYHLALYARYSPGDTSSARFEIRVSFSEMDLPEETKQTV